MISLPTNAENVRKRFLDTPETAADFAGAAAFLEIGDRLGILPLLEKGDPVTAAEIAEATGLPVAGVADYLEAMTAAALVQDAPRTPGAVQLAADYEQTRYEAGYLSWALNANRPFIENSARFLHDREEAIRHHDRDFRQVAVSSHWMGSKGFYTEATDTIRAARPSRMVDLGAGTGRLLIDTLREFPDTTGVALDFSAGACEEARRAADRAGVGPRLEVVVRTIQSIADDPAPLEGADLIHAGFVFHDMMPEEESIADAVLANCRDALKPGGIMAITEAVPYVRNSRERRFSALVTYYHRTFMGRRLLDETEWKEKLLKASFAKVDCVQARFPTGRLFVATKK